MDVTKLKNIINEANEVKETDISEYEPTKESLSELIPSLEEFEIKFYGECEGEVGGTVDYVYGGLKDTHYETEGDTGFITLEHPFLKQDDKYITKEDEWKISCYWSTDFFEVKEESYIETIEEVYSFIEEISSRFENFELETIYR